MEVLGTTLGFRPPFIHQSSFLEAVMLTASTVTFSKNISIFLIHFDFSMVVILVWGER